MICKHAVNGTCQISNELAGIEIPLDSQACDVCQKDKEPMSLNQVTCYRARFFLLKSKMPVPPKVQECVKSHKTVVLLNEGPGTELKKLIEWFPIGKSKKCRKCSSLEIRMNQWGPDKCESKMPYIVKKLMIAAKRRGIPTTERLVTIVVNKAIRQARKNQ